MSALLTAGSLEVCAINYSVPYVRGALTYLAPDWVNGYGAVIGELEVRNAEGNGIDGFDGHRHLALGPDIANGQYGFQDVKDFCTGDPVTGNPADSFFHGTFVAGIMANNASLTLDGTNVPFSGVAPGAKYYGAIFAGAGDKASTLTLNSSLYYLTQTVGARAINSSWGGDISNATLLDGSTFVESLLMDEYAGYYGKTNGTTGRYLDTLMVIAAGNSGSLLGAPADSYNGLAVGALDVLNPAATGLADPGRVPVSRVASYSAWQPLANGRCGVSIVAPGTALWSDLALNVAESWGFPAASADSIVAGTADGTSFAAPHVTGVAALLYGVAAPVTNDYGGGLIFVTQPNSAKGTLLDSDHKLIKAVLLNSADKIAGCDSNGVTQALWQPGEISVGVDGITNSIHPLNYAVGSGQVNAPESVYSLQEVSNRFWDVSVLTADNPTNLYVYGQDKFITFEPYAKGLRLTATLVWDRRVDYIVDTNTNTETIGSLLDTNLLSNLDLILQEETAPGVWADIYRSISTEDNVEQIYMDYLSATNHYRLDVIANYLVDPVGGEQYALAVSYLPIPEPSTAALAGLCALAALARRRWRGRQRDDAEPADGALTLRARAVPRCSEKW
jgi:hypothetical protein